MDGKTAFITVSPDEPFFTAMIKLSTFGVSFREFIDGK